MVEIRSSLAILEGSREFFPALIAAIDRAQETIYLESYLIRDDTDTRAVLDALIAARQRGVAVFLLLDGFGSVDAATWVKTLLVPAGVEVEFYRPGIRWLAPKTWRRLHRKLALIDETIGFVGGINLVGDYFDETKGRLEHPRLDFAVQVTTFRALRAISHVMRRTWWRVSLRNTLRGSVGRLLETDQRDAEMGRVREAWRKTRRHLRWRGPPVRKSASFRARLLLRDNLRFRRKIEQWYLWRILLAQREILIANAYFVPTYRFRAGLIKAAARGVRVRLLIQGNSDQWWTHWATQALIEELHTAGVEIYYYLPGILHAKVAVIDDAITVGSSNIDPFSLMLSLEANLVAEDTIIASHLRERLESAIGQAIRLETVSVTPRGALRSVIRKIALTMVLMALRIFASFSRTGYEVH